MAKTKRELEEMKKSRIAKGSLRDLYDKVTPPNNPKPSAGDIRSGKYKGKQK